MNFLIFLALLASVSAWAEPRSLVCNVSGYLGGHPRSPDARLMFEDVLEWPANSAEGLQSYASATRFYFVEAVEVAECEGSFLAHIKRSGLVLDGTLNWSNGYAQAYLKVTRRTEQFPNDLDLKDAIIGGQLDPRFRGESLLSEELGRIRFAGAGTRMAQVGPYWFELSCAYRYLRDAQGS